MKFKEANHYKTEFHNPFYGDPQFLYPVAAKFKKMFGWQHNAFEDGKDARFFATQAFCGSGKSILQINLAIYDIISSGYRQKQLIVVPQEHIHRGFVGEGDLNFLSICQNGQEYEWNIQPEHNFCDGKDRLDGLKDWLLMPSQKLAKGFNGNTIGGLNSICSHAALIGVWKNLSEDEKIQVIRNLTLRIDEAHHINHVFLDSEELTPEERLAIDYEATELGRVCTYIINSKIKTVKLHLTTATMYRGDRRTILSKEVRGKFVEYNLDWIEHFRSLGIKSFYLQYEEYKVDPINQIVKRIKAEPKEKHFVVVPSSSHKWRKDGDEYKELLTEINKLGLRVLDLITPETQDRNKKLLLKEPKANNSDTPSNFDVVVVCMLGREGTDWCPCSRLHNASCENSITLAVQTIGRPFRRYEGKDVVKIYHYTKQFSMPKAGLTKRELLSDRTNALLVCMQINDMTNPILVPVIPKQGEGGNVVGQTKNTLESIFGDQYNNVLQSSLEKYECLENYEKTPKGVFELAGIICDEYGIPKNHENRNNVQLALTARILREVCPELKLEGIDVSFIRKHGFDKIAAKYELDKSIYFGDYSEADWKIIRNIITAKRSLDEWQRIAKELAFKNNGRIPSGKWLKINGYNGLNVALSKYPELFDLDQDRENNGVEEWVVIAENLAEEHNGILPCSSWLCSNGLSGLAKAIRENPDNFYHIEMDNKRGKTPDEWVLIAENLSIDNGGILQNSKWLQDNGYGGLSQVMAEFPEKFCHIKQINKAGTSIDEWVVKAEDLAKENNGILPSKVWLARNGLPQLKSAIDRCPEKFNHIQQLSDRIYINEHIDNAKTLTEKHKGKLPCVNWLKNNGYSALASAIIKHPEEFCDINREIKIGKTINEWIEIAEELAKKYGACPNSSELKEMGYNGLVAVMYSSKHAHNFSHITQSVKAKTLTESITDAENLAIENRGILPSCKWMKQNGYSYIIASMTKYPDSFNHIDQIKLRRPMDEIVNLAEKLAAENGGMLPSYTEIRKFDQGLASALHAKSEFFTHIPRSKVFLSGDDLVLKAEQLAEENGGLLPSVSKLKKLGILWKAMKNRPNDFSHINQEKESKTNKHGKTNNTYRLSAVKRAEQLAEENGGLLPPSSELRKIDDGIRQAMQKYPNLFSHIKQERKGPLPRGIDGKFLKGVNC